MPADEDAIRQVPAGAWKPGLAQDGGTEDDKDVAEVTGLMTRAGNWPGGLRWIARRVKPSRRQARNLTAYEKETGWRYSITCTNVPDDGIPGVPGSHHAQYIDVVHREHAVVETGGVRTAKAIGLEQSRPSSSSRRLGRSMAAYIDFKIECGIDRETGDLLVADVIDSDSGRLRFGEVDMSKQSYRDGTATLPEIRKKFDEVAALTDRFFPEPALGA